MTRESSAQRFALDEWHREVRKALGLPCGQQRYDVRVLEASRERNLASETLDAHHRGRLGRQHLDDDATVERHLLREEDARHPATAQLARNRVRDAEGIAQLLLEGIRHAGR